MALFLTYNLTRFTKPFSLIVNLPTASVTNSILNRPTRNHYIYLDWRWENFVWLYTKTMELYAANKKLPKIRYLAQWVFLRNIKGRAKV